MTDKFVEGFVEACYKSGLTEKQASSLMEYYVTQNGVEGIEKAADANGLIKALLAILGAGGLAYGVDYLGTTNTPIGNWLKNNLGAGSWGINNWVNNNILNRAGSTSAGLASPEDTKMYKAPDKAPEKSKSFTEAAGKLAQKTSDLGHSLINLPWKAEKTIKDTWSDTKRIAGQIPQAASKVVNDGISAVDRTAAGATDWVTDKVDSVNKILQ